MYGEYIVIIYNNIHVCTYISQILKILKIIMSNISNLYTI